MALWEYILGYTNSKYLPFHRVPCLLPASLPSRPCCLATTRRTAGEQTEIKKSIEYQDYNEKKRAKQKERKRNSINGLVQTATGSIKTCCRSIAPYGHKCKNCISILILRMYRTLYEWRTYWRRLFPTFKVEKTLAAQKCLWTQKKIKEINAQFKSRRWRNCI